LLYFAEMLNVVCICIKNYVNKLFIRLKERKQFFAYRSNKKHAYIFFAVVHLSSSICSFVFIKKKEKIKCIE